ncbi:kinesin light chain 3 [Zopfia rhizophila CBS 207.26]|uniref:Kinesin light chain 3 n=1 Tax=Zopfia rhizophila CBS 207.26 TaxID=1314779 RepID=A0A6A6DPD5_9PEZI|nr:kinesin light chain 3 [Zopfia rhizophila CBS 207.26]
MRLLHFNHSGRLGVTDFRGKTIPPYAVLSHRWGDFEVSFEDVERGIYKEKDGYQKIEFCAKQAAQDQLQHFWIDTCCIDKWNVLERSKAINSMFSWYRNATRCYVFLSDVSISTTTETHYQSTWEASFRASEWFTRGWTLQELIAPVSVEFFSREGRRIGDKKSLEQLVHEITSIPLRALQNYPLDEFTKDERTKWARSRRTTEEEDNVYCLLGILDVSMPISYGEGKEKAWRRLYSEVETASSAPSIIPFFQNDRFVGRESQLAELEAKLFGGKQTTMMAITGPGGTGKSQLALELAYKTKQKSKSCSVFWIDASDMNSLHQGYWSIAQKLDVPGWDDEKVDVKQLVKHHLSRKGKRQWLLIFDNADNADLWSPGLSTTQTASSTDYLPQSELGSIIFTTTDCDIAKMLAPQIVIELEEMTPDAAQRMFKNYLNAPIEGSEQKEAKLLLEELSYLPLAIVQAVAYINTNNITLQKYRSKLIRYKEDALERSSKLSQDKQQEYDTKSPVAPILLISVDQIRHTNPLAANYLFLSASVDRKDIPLDLLEASTPCEKEDAVKLLSRYALVTRRPADSAIDLHRLIHHALREWLQWQEWLGQWTQNAVTQLVRVFPNPDHGSRSKWRRLLPHAKYALSHSLAKEVGGDRLDLVWKLATALYNDGRYSECEELTVQAMMVRKRLLGDVHSDTLISMSHLALTYMKQGRWKEAEELEVQVIEVRKRVFGEEHPDTLASMGNLALAYKDQGRWKNAQELTVQVMEARKRVLGDVHPDTLISMSNLALTYRNQGQWKEAEELTVQVIEASSRVLGDEHPDTLNSMNNLASTYLKQRRWREAEELTVQVIEARKRVLGDEHPDTLNSMNNLASTYMEQRKWGEAEELQVQVIEARKRILGDKHPDTLNSISSLALIYIYQGLWKEAEELQVQVMEASLRVLGHEHLHTLTSISSLASTYSNQGRWKEAEELQVQIMEAGSRVLGHEHPHTLTGMANLASTYRNQGRWKEAEELDVRVIETRKRVLGEEHPDTLTSMNNLAFTLEGQVSINRAISLMEDCCELQTVVLGPQHPSTVSSRETLATWRLKVTELIE